MNIFHTIQCAKCTNRFVALSNFQSIKAFLLSLESVFDEKSIDFEF